MCYNGNGGEEQQLSPPLHTLAPTERRKAVVSFLLFYTHYLSLFARLRSGNLLGFGQVVRQRILIP